MRSPARVLNSLTKHSQTTEYRFERLYRILFNEEMYYLAYQRIYAKPGNMTQGADGETIDRMSLPRIEKLILSLKDESYSPQPSRRVHIPKKNGKTRPLGVPHLPRSFRCIKHARRNSHIRLSAGQSIPGNNPAQAALARRKTHINPLSREFHAMKIVCNFQICPYLGD